uniref:Ig-like domain-containing protein n=1 Tax=Sinocyclocheilus anshuiensis TaxID=1608454 RepID=A0A671NEJ0_9TELE
NVKHIVLGLSSLEMKVRPGDNITLFCDHSATLGSSIVWIRNCSHENQPSLIIDFRKLDVEIFQRFSFIHNLYNNSYDLHITNISVSDLGLYYCAKLEIKVNEDGKGIISSSEVYYYVIFQHSLIHLYLFYPEQVTSCSGPLNTTSTPPPVSDCLLCWMLLFSVCPVCCLFSSICVFCLCCRKATGNYLQMYTLLLHSQSVTDFVNDKCYYFFL